MEKNIDSALTRRIMLDDGSELVTIVEKGLKNSFSTYHSVKGKRPKLIAPGIVEETIGLKRADPPQSTGLHGGVRFTTFWFDGILRIIPHKTTDGLANEARDAIIELLEEDPEGQGSVILLQPRVTGGTGGAGLVGGFRHFEYNGNITACVYKYKTPWVVDLSGRPNQPGPPNQPGQPNQPGPAGWYHKGVAYYHAAHNIAKLELSTLNNYWYYHYILKNDGGGTSSTLVVKCFNDLQRERLGELIEKIARVIEIYQREIDESREDPESAEASCELIPGRERSNSNIPWCIRSGKAMEYLQDGTGNLGDQWVGDTLRERITRLSRDVEEL